MRLTSLRTSLNALISSLFRGSAQERAFYFCIKICMNIDPCMGSGHILVYAFDVLMEIYRECGYVDRDAVLIVK